MKKNLAPYPNMPHINVRALSLLYFALFTLCAIGHSLAYFGPLSSAYWWYLDGEFAWALGILRVFVVTLLSLLALHNMGYSGTVVRSARGISSLFPYKRISYLLLIASLIILPLLVFGLGKNVIERMPNGCDALFGPSEFARVWKPYLTYSLYIYGLWAGMFLYYFYCIAGCLLYDRRWIKENKALLVKEMSDVGQIPSDASEQLARVQSLFEVHASAIRNVVQRYTVAVLAVILALVVESRLAETVSEHSQEWAKFATGGALFLVFAISCFVIIRYEVLWKKMDQYALEKMSLKSRDLGSSERVEEAGWSTFHRKIILQNGPVELLRSVFLKYGVVIPLALVILAVVFGVYEQPYKFLVEAVRIILPDMMGDVGQWLADSVGGLSPYREEVQAIEDCVQRKQDEIL